MEWESVKLLTEKAQYQKCVDKLEGLVVARLFELTRMNMSQTGYKLRKHISYALKTRSQAICTALDNYNRAAAALKPPGPKLDWETDVRQKRWSEPAVRVVMDKYFKYLRAGEEIERLNLEIRRLATYLHDEDDFLLSKVEELLPVNPPLAHQIRLYHSHRGRFWEGGVTGKVSGLQPQGEDGKVNELDVIRWWGDTYPTLSRMTRDYLAIQGSGTPSERAFSSAGLTDHKSRNRLKPEMFAATQTLKAAYHNGHISAHRQASEHCKGPSKSFGRILFWRRRGQ
ncbi:hypothetical protein D9758_012358 [Tetrapyrgos nigripes]|uniref:HAT C-terminal dimerisation domain-containing protein n=1 Tax=Tetrapyrgos nigripes TaxID=182062 RepID=A0A8H5CM33_9AGAR|nr:hypothetical protein D9758_012358 [Tetrapyrgos nigripes]